MKEIPDGNQCHKLTWTLRYSEQLTANITANSGLHATYAFIYLFMPLFIHVFIYIFIHAFIYLFIHMSGLVLDIWLLLFQSHSQIQILT